MSKMLSETPELDLDDVGMENTITGDIFEMNMTTHEDVELGINEVSKIKTIRDVNKRNESYNAYVDNITPKASCKKNCLKAFVVGGFICVLGQVILNLWIYAGFDKDNAALMTTISLVALSVLLTGIGVYPILTTFGGAGSLVPITGFANSVAASAIEFKKEGQVFGIGCKIFTIAGPVILYGIFFSWVAGFIYWLFSLVEMT